MAEATFVFDDGSLYSKLSAYLNSTLSKDEFTSYLNKMEEIFIHIQKKEYGVIYFTDVFLYEKINDEFISEILYSSSGTDRDLFLRICKLDSYFRKYVADDEMNDEIMSNDSGFIASSFIDNRYCAFISDRDIKHKSWWDKNKHFYVEDNQTILSSYRDIVYSKYSNYADISNYAAKLWSNCYFHNEASRFEKFEVSEIQYLSTMLHHLNYLNDHAKQDYKLGSDKFIESAKQNGINLSPESTKTRASNSKMKLRNIKINSTDVCCEWHSKLTPQAGRIHFHHGDNQHTSITTITENRVIIGKYVKHLSTA